MQPVVASADIIATLSWFNNWHIIAMIMKQEVLRMSLGDNIQYLRKVTVKEIPGFRMDDML